MKINKIKKSKVVLYNGDCLEEMKKIENESIDMVLTDPPYGTTACEWDSIIPFVPMWSQLNRVTKKSAAIALSGSEPFSSALRMSNIKNYKYDWKWIKDKGSNFLHAKYRPINISEDLIIFSNKALKYKPQMRVTGKKSNRGGKAKSKGYGVYGKIGFKQSYRDTNIKYPINCIKFNTPKHNDKRNGSLHPTQKPVELMEYLIKTYTLPGETVLDFTMGSGTVGVAAKKLGRRFIGIELDKKYFITCQNRIESTGEGGVYALPGR